MKKTDDFKKYKDSPCPSNGGIKIIKLAILPKAICRFNAIPIKIPMSKTNNPKIYMEPKKTPNCQSNLDFKQGQC